MDKPLSSLRVLFQTHNPIQKNLPCVAFSVRVKVELHQFCNIKGRVVRVKFPGSKVDDPVGAVQEIGMRVQFIRINEDLLIRLPQHDTGCSVVAWAAES